MKEFFTNDLVFGPHTITEPVVVDLVHTPSFQRLKHIDQAGYAHPFFPRQKKHTRFEHSLGVYLLLNQYGASLEEQVAGLLHDVSHAAFSHCIDYALENSEAGKTQAHQDNVFEAFVRKSEIPEVLSRHGMDVEIILDDSRFPLKEQPLPRLCADRIDYSFRSALASEVRAADHIQTLLHNLSTNGRDWFFTNHTFAREYAELFSTLNASLWSGIHSATMFKTVGDCLRYACTKGYLVYDDFYGTDEGVLEKITSHLPSDPHLQHLFDRMNNKIPLTVTLVEDSGKTVALKTKCRTTCRESDGTMEQPVFCKSRAVDPLYLHQGTLLSLSQTDPSWSSRLHEEERYKSYVFSFDG